MTDIAMTTATEPDSAPRVAGLDILRGLAILAILFMNIGDMGGSLWAFWAQDIRHVGWSEADRTVWFVREVFANGTARCLLEMLFGVGMVILTDRAAGAAEGKWPVLRAYWWRNIVLFAFGLVHIFVLLWPGDILHTYGLAALIAVFFRRLGPKTLLAFGLAIALLQVVGGGIGYVMVPQQQAELARLEAAQAEGRRLSADEAKTLKDGLAARAERDRRHREDMGRIAAEDAARGGSSATFGSWARSAWDFTLFIQKQGLEILFVLEALSTMLVGAALYRWGIIQGRRSTRFYLAMTVACYAVGLGSRTVGALAQMRADDAPNVMWSLSEVARIATTLGHVGIVYLLLATALAVNAVLLLWANWYVRHYDIAPVEWAWRSLVARRMLPFRRSRGRSMGGERPMMA